MDNGERHARCWEGTCPDYIPIEKQAEKLKAYGKDEIIEILKIQERYSNCVTDAMRHRIMSRLEDRKGVIEKMKKYENIFERQIKQLEEDIQDPWIKSIYKAWEDKKDLF
ncbi:MAG: hypothetical protein HZB68_04010 [Candidatus Aenigmarchaeota archaeon]|nr:hypothetical protein [Candidatus Aenigmarchaeota archaeon]